jgi:DamX protein
MGSSRLPAVANIARSPRLQEQASIYKILRNGQDWYVLLYGVYNSRSEAKAAITGLPAGLRKNTPWLRPYADVQQEIRVGKK